MKFLLLLFLAFNILLINAQDPNSEKIRIIDFGIEFQAYPTGYIPGFHLSTNLTDKDAINFRVALNIFDHQDFPKQAGINDHISEKGIGFGYSIGYKHFFWKYNKNLFIGFRSDMWFNNVSWETENNMKGVTNIVVVQPTIETGWLFEIGKQKNIYISPKVAFGYEWNAIVNGEQTGYGFILLGGINLGYRFKK